MYSEHYDDGATRRTNDAFLRRMLGGELSGNQTVREGGKSYCNLCDRPHEREMRGRTPSRCASGNFDTPSRCASGNFDTPCRGDGVRNACHDHVHAPSLAMVYSPKQCFQNLLSPTEALAQGSLFAELVLPLEVECKKTRKEGCCRR